MLTDYDHAYDGGDIRLWRTEDGTAHANVPHALIIHSPTGYEWGYAGSGPADLALNILLAVSGDPEWSKQVHQQFKSEFLVGVPNEGATITRAKIDEFILANS